MNEFKSKLRRPVTLLLVEPDVILNFFICEFLETAGFEVFDVSSAEEAVTVLQTHSEIDAVIIEYAREDQTTDASFIQTVAKEFPHAALFVVSDQAIIPAGLPPSAKILTKPFEPEVVIKILTHFVDENASWQASCPSACQ